jgi:hypothetical protein
MQTADKNVSNKPTGALRKELLTSGVFADWLDVDKIRLAYEHDSYCAICRFELIQMKAKHADFTANLCAGMS